jgi:hypothetical protein
MLRAHILDPHHASRILAAGITAALLAWLLLQ